MRSLVLSAGSGGRTTKAEVGADDCASVADEYRVCSLHNCEDFFRFGNVGLIAESD